MKKFTKDGKMFNEMAENSPMKDGKLLCIGNINDVFTDEAKCMPFYRLWIFFNPEERRFYAFWDVGNGYYSPEYFEADTLKELWKDIEKEGSDNL